MGKNGENGHPCLIPDLRRKTFNLSPLSIMLAMHLLYVTFIMFSYIPSVPNLLRVVIMKGCCILLNGFSASVERIM